MSELPTPTPGDEPHNCPHCGVNLLGEPIPDDSLQHYGNGRIRYFKREIGYYSMEYDRTMYVTCPDCKEKL